MCDQCNAAKDNWPCVFKVLVRKKDLTAIELRVLLLIVFYKLCDDIEVIPQKIIGEEMGLSRKRINEISNSLVKKNYLSKISKHGEASAYKILFSGVKNDN